MSTGYMYASAKGLMRLTPPRLKSALLFFDHIKVKVEEPARSLAVDQYPESIGWLVDSEIVETISSTDLPGAVAELEIALLESLVESYGGVAQWSYEMFHFAISNVIPSRPRPMLTEVHNAEIDNGALMDVGLADKLHSKGLALKAGARLSAAYGTDHSLLSDLQASLDELASIHTPSGDFEYHGDIMEAIADRSARVCQSNAPDDSCYVLMHPIVADLHAAIMMVAGTVVGSSRGETWIPFHGGFGWFAERPEWSELYLEPLHQAMSSADVRVGRLVTTETDYLGVDVDAMSLEQILDFRDENRSLLDAYLEGLQVDVCTGSLSGSDELERLTDHRLSQLEAASRDVRAAAIRRFGIKAVGAAIAASGFAWPGQLGGPLAATAAVASGLSTFLSAPEARADTRFAYLLALP